MEIIPTGPGIPDPAQLTLFDTPAGIEKEPCKDIRHDDQGREGGVTIRSPTSGATSREMADSLLRKSRELVRKFFENARNQNENNDSASNNILNDEQSGPASYDSGLYLHEDHDRDADGANIRYTPIEEKA